MSDKVICLSGGFDPLHSGHVEMIEEAAKFGRVIVILNSDQWLKRKKGYAFMSYDERRRILKALRCVDSVVSVFDEDGTVCATLEYIKPDYFGNGGDRTDKNTPEMTLCEKLGIKMVWGLGGGKTQSSSELVERSKDIMSRLPKPAYKYNER